MQDASLINGLLAKRIELQRESVDARQRVACLTNDLEALDRVLEACGYRSELTGTTPVQTRLILFHRNEIRGYIMEQLRASERAMTPREIAERICSVEGKEAQDRRLLASVTTKVSENLRKMKTARLVTSEPIGKGNTHGWRLAQPN